MGIFIYNGIFATTCIGLIGSVIFLIVGLRKDFSTSFLQTTWLNISTLINIIWTSVVLYSLQTRNLIIAEPVIQLMCFMLPIFWYLYILLYTVRRTGSGWTTPKIDKSIITLVIVSFTLALISAIYGFGEQTIYYGNVVNAVVISSLKKLLVMESPLFLFYLKNSFFIGLTLLLIGMNILGFSKRTTQVHKRLTFLLLCKTLVQLAWAIVDHPETTLTLYAMDTFILLLIYQQISYELKWVKNIKTEGAT